MGRPQRSAGLSMAVLSLAAAACLEAPPAGGPDGQDAGPCPGNLVENGSFEETTEGWVVAFGSFALVADAYEGELAAEVCSDGTSDEENFYSLDDMPASVPDPKTGERYELSVWIRAGPQIEPQVVEVAVREYDGEGLPHPSQTPVMPGASWRQVTASLVVESPAPRNVDAYVASKDPRLGNCFQVDSICLTRSE